MDTKQSCNYTYLATLIAVELTRDKTTKEICELKNLLSQVCCTLSSICTFRLTK